MNSSGEILRRRITKSVASALGAALMAVVVPMPALAAEGAPDVAAAEPPVAVHNVYVAKVLTDTAYADTDAAMLATIDAALDRWDVESEHRIDLVRRGGFVAFKTATDCQSASGLRAEAKTQAALQGIRFGSNTGNHLIVMAPDGCTGGSGTVGHYGLQSGGELAFSYRASKSLHTLYHELGHNFGLEHANAVRCTPACQWAEYRNHYAAMGTTMIHTPAYVPAALDTYERSLLGVVAAGEVSSVVLPAGQRTTAVTVDLHGRGTADGVRGMKVVDPSDGATYYVDFRNGVGRDAGSYYPTSTARDEFFYNKGVTVEKVIIDPDDNESSELRTFPQSDGSGWRYAKVAGETFETEGLRLEVENMDLTGAESDTARVRITLTDTSVPLGDQTGELVLSGDWGVGDTMTASPTGWSTQSHLGDIQWYADGSAIAGAVGPRYTIAESLHGHELSVGVTGTREGFKDRTVRSDSVLVGAGRPGSLVSGGVYELGRVGTAQVVTDPDASTVNGTQMVVENGRSADSQRWTASLQSDGSYLMKNLVSGRCLDNAASSMAEGSRVIQWSCHGGSNQRWTLVGSGTGYALINQRSGLALTPAGTASGSVLTQDAGSQPWVFSRVG